MKKFLNKKLLVFFFLIIGIGLIIDYSLFKPSKINFLIATKLYGSPVNSAFTDENFYKCVIDEYNKENNTSLPYTTDLSDEQLANINKLWCDNKNIENLTGIEKFISLTVLYIAKNELTSIDISQNSSLKYLSIYENQLTNLDLSHNPVLEDLNASYNQITNLDVSQNSSLKDLNVLGNQLTNLDVSNNLALTRLDVQNNQLTNLDISNNLALENLNVTGNQITNLDVSNNLSLESLYVSDNKLTNLDVSRNSLLKYLYVNKNQLTNLDVNNHLELQYLNTQGNQLTNLNISNTPKLRDLNINYNKLSSLDVSQNSELKILNASNNFEKNIVLFYNQKGFIDATGKEFLKSTKEFHLILNNSQHPLLDFEENMFSIKCDSCSTNLTTVYTTDDNNFNFNVKYNIIVVNIESSKYIIDTDDNYIYTTIDTNNETIFNNINLTNADDVEGVIENNKYIIKHNDEIIKEFDLININSDKYDLTKDYIFDFDENILSNINVLNGDKAINDNKIQIKKGEDVLQEFDYVSATSDKYGLSLDKIKVQDNNIESLISNINCINCSVKIKNNDKYKTSGNFTDGDSLVITYNDEILKEYSLSYAVSGVSLNSNDLTLNLNKKNTFKLEAMVLPSKSENKNVIWESSDSSVASVDNNGNVTAHSLGNAIITVKTEEGEFTAECNVNVVEISTYTVTYPDNSTQEYEENGRITFKTDLTRQGYKLVGYKYNNKDYKLTDELLMPSQDITLEAIWELVIPDATNNNKYVLEDNYFKNINLNTDIANLDLGLDSIYNVKITKDNVEKTSGLIGTGDIINIYLGDTLVTNYTVIIKGDVTGNGKVLIGDVSRAYQYLKKKISMEDCYVKAADVGQVDGVIKVGDISKLYQYLKGKIKEL